MKMKSSVIGIIRLRPVFAMVLAIGFGLATTSCVTTTGHWVPDFPEKGSAKGGASLLMKRP